MEIATIATLGFLVGALVIGLTVTIQKLNTANYKMWKTEDLLKIEKDYCEYWRKEYGKMYDRCGELYNKTPEGIVKVARKKMQAKTRKLLKR